LKMFMIEAKQHKSLFQSNFIVVKYCLCVSVCDVESALRMKMVKHKKQVDA